MLCITAIESVDLCWEVFHMAGNVILSEEPYVSVPSKTSGCSRCDWCFTSSNLKRCSSCQAVWYCGSTCQVYEKLKSVPYIHINASLFFSLIFLYVRLAGFVNKTMDFTLHWFTHSLNNNITSPSLVMLKSYTKICMPMSWCHPTSVISIFKSRNVLISICLSIDFQ